MGNNIIFSKDKLRDRLYTTYINADNPIAALKAHWGDLNLKACIFLKLLNTAEYYWENILYQMLEENINDLTLETFMENIGEFILNVKDIAVDEVGMTTKEYNKIYYHDYDYEKLNTHNIYSFSQWLHAVVLPTLPKLMSNFNEFNSWCLITSAINADLFPSCKAEYTKKMISDAKNIVCDYGFELQAETMPFVNSVYNKLVFEDSIRYRDLKPLIVEELNMDDKFYEKSEESGIYYLDVYLKSRYIPK